MHWKAHSTLAWVVAVLVAGISVSGVAQESTPQRRVPDQTIRRWYQEGNYRAIIDSLRGVPSDSLATPTLVLLGESQAALLELDDAARTYGALKGRDTASIAFRFQLARILVQAGRTKDAGREYAALVAMDSTYAPGLIATGDLLADRRDAAGALKHYHRALMLNRRNVRLNYLVGRSLVQLDRPDSALGYLAVGLTVQPDHVPSLALLASIHYSKGRTDEALRLYTAASTADPENVDYLLSIGLCRLKLRNAINALPPLRAALVRDPRNSVVMSVLGQALFELQRFDTAAVVYASAAAVDPDNPSLWLNLSLTLARMDSIARAVPAMEKAIAASDPDRLAYAFRQLGALFYNGARFSEAMTAYERSLAIAPDDLDSRFFYAATLDRLGRKAPAVAAYRRYLAKAQKAQGQEQYITTARSRVKELSAK